ncbi:hypothetical protein [Cellulomonas composti]|uniref:Uncharacterized protein n=1 Tax=Cellulomonas composti TaxID=266130 RepID=A0A511JDJ6_9CELL|nr:hypothetical protein [Cellulomonas composti]GEL96016.1 hypothetical protein CCO02nite_26740 [Cellulomonas composti]
MPARPLADEIDVRLLRADDLVVARITAPGCRLDETAAGTMLVAAGTGATLVVHLPPQHVGEQAVPESDPENTARVMGHRIAEPSRLVLEVPQGTSIPFTLSGILGAIPTLRLKVAPLATPAPVIITPLPGPPFVFEGARAAVADAGSLADLVLGDRSAAHASTRLDAPAARVLQHAQAVRTVRGTLRGVVSDAELGAILDAARVAEPRPSPIAAPPPVIVVPQPGPPVVVVPRTQVPRAPRDDETSIEAPYRLTISPSARGAFLHPTEPVRDTADGTRVELFRTHLSVRVEDSSGAFVGHDEANESQRIVRAIWTRDLTPADAGALTDPPAIAPQSLKPPHRRAVVRQSADVRLPKAPVPIPVKRLALSSLGAWIDWTGTWVEADIANPPSGTAMVTLYKHQAVMGRDTYVRVEEPGFLFPFGHKCVWVTVTERKIKSRGPSTAFLWQRQFIIVRQPTRLFGGHDSPLAQVTLEPIVTPNLDDPGPLTKPFVPKRDGQNFAFTLVTTDRAGKVSTYSAPLTFVPSAILSSPTIQADAETAYAPVRTIDARGQNVSLAVEATPGDTALDLNELEFTATVQAAQFTSQPRLVQVNAVVPSMRHLAPSAPGVDLVYSPQFLSSGDDGFDGANGGQVFLALAGPPPAVDFSGGSDRSGGFLAPNLVVRGLSRSLGAVGEDGSSPGSGLKEGKFDPEKFLDDAFPKLFGLFSLLDILEAIGLGLDDAPDFVTEALDTVSQIVSAADRLRQAAEQSGPRMAKELAGAAHDGAAGAIEAAKNALEAAVTPLVTALTHLVDTVEALPDAPDVPTAITSVTTALTQVADAVDDLLTAIGAPQIPAVVRAELERPAKVLKSLEAAADTLQALQAFAESLLSPDVGVTARFEWRPQIASWPSEAKPVLKINDKRGLRLAIEVRASADSTPSVDIAAEFADFALVLLPGAPLMGLTFQRIGFRASSAGKVEVDVVFGGIEFLGCLEFIETLRRMIPFDGFADPPYVDVSPEGVTAGFDVALPSVAIGVFALENISLGADARVPFLGDAVTVGFHFCSKDSPFRLTVMCIGGGGWVELRVSPKGMVLLEVGLEATACLSIDLGVASGSVSIAVGVYIRMEAEKGLLTAYFRIRGEVDVLGLISASITLELSLTYHFETGKLVGKASLVVEVEVLFFSASVEITVEKKLAGSKGDPTLKDVLPPAPDGTNADWSAYCEAFAPLPA